MISMIRFRGRKLKRLASLAFVVGALVSCTTGAERPAISFPLAKIDFPKHFDLFDMFHSEPACLRALRSSGVSFVAVPDKDPVWLKRSHSKRSSRNFTKKIRNSRTNYRSQSRSRVKAGCRYQDAVDITAFGDVPVPRPVILRCAMASRVSQWIKNTVQPTAQRLFKQRVKKILAWSGYRCSAAKGLWNGRYRRRLSQHGLANALDISGFILEDGTRIEYKRYWFLGGESRRGSKKKKARKSKSRSVRKVRKRNSRKISEPRKRQAFLKSISLDACDAFQKVFSPDWDRQHWNHLHVDLAPAKLCGIKGEYRRPGQKGPLRSKRKKRPPPRYSTSHEKS